MKFPKKKIVPDTKAFNDVINMTPHFNLMFNAFKHQMIDGRFHKNVSIFNEMGYEKENVINVVSFEINTKIYNIRNSHHRLPFDEVLEFLTNNGFEHIGSGSVTFQIFKNLTDNTVVVICPTKIGHVRDVEWGYYSDYDKIFEKFPILLT